MIGKGSQLSAIVVKNGGNFFKGKEKTTTTNAIRKMKLLHTLHFLTGKRAVENTFPPMYFDFKSDAPHMHAVVCDIMHKFWGPRDWSTVWGTGLVWFTTEKTYIKGEANTNSVFWAGLDREEHVRALIPLRPLNRLRPYLEHWFPPHNEGGLEQQQQLFEAMERSGGGGNGGSKSAAAISNHPTAGAGGKPGAPSIKNSSGNAPMGRRRGGAKRRRCSGEEDDEEQEEDRGAADDEAGSAGPKQ